jgi:hypothetical protein
VFSENLNQFFETNDFAVDAVINYGSNQTRDLKVIFETPSQSVEIYDTSIEADAPRLSCKTSDLNQVKQYDTVTLQNSTYKIERINHDGTGISFLYLK